jgi:hypothetical protein
VNIRAVPTLLTLSLTALGCGAKAIDLDSRPVDGPVDESSAEPGVFAVVREKVIKLAAFDQRLYWAGVSDPEPVTGRQRMSIRSCEARDCAATLVTYEADLDSALSPTFSVQGGELYWYRGPLQSLLACPIEGCDGSPRTVGPALPAYNGTFADNRFYFADSNFLYSLSLAESAPQAQVVLVGPVGQGLMIDDAYAYWVAVESVTDHFSSCALVRSRKDGSMREEIVTSDVKCSTIHAFDVATDQTAIYWTNNVLAGSIARCPRAGCMGAPETVVAPLRAPQKLLRDGSQLFYEYEAAPDAYALASCTLPACAAQTSLIERLDAPAAFATDDRHVYAATTEQDVNPQDLPTATITSLHQLLKPQPDMP